MRPKEIVRYADERTSLPVFNIIKQIYQYYANNRYLNRFRRLRDSLRGRISSHFWNEPKDLHVGCGYQRFDDAINMDYVHTPATDYVMDATKTPFPDQSIQQIETYHMVEHVPRPDARQMFEEWNRILVSEGKLILELPDFDGVIKQYLEEDEPEKVDLLLKYVFGSQRFESDFHHWGWNFERLEEELKEAGFDRVEQTQPQDYHAEEAPCLRVEAYA